MSALMMGLRSWKNRNPYLLRTFFATPPFLADSSRSLRGEICPGLPELRPRAWDRRRGNDVSIAGRNRLKLGSDNFTGVVVRVHLFGTAHGLRRQGPGLK